MDHLKSIFAATWGCDLAHVEGPDKSHLGMRINRLKYPPNEFDGSVSSLKLTFNGRWGNYVFQLINMCYLAERIGCNVLYIHSTDMFPLVSARRIEGLEMRPIDESDDAVGYQLESVFFDMSVFQNLMSELTPDRRRQLAIKYVRPLLSKFAKEPVNNPVESALLFHIRSGDIFEGEEGQGGSQVGGPLYVQPPLSFYQMIAETQVKRGFLHAIIMAENSNNPTIYPLCDSLQKQGFAVSLRLQHDLAADIGYLLGAKHVVFANGTIGVAAALLSETISEAYFFRKNGTGTNHDVDCYLGDFVKKHYLFDEEGSYIKKGEWKNTASQRRLMVELSRQKLHWQKAPMPFNIALNKPATQSSFSIFSLPDESQRAVNGVIDGKYSFHTEREHFPWWEVDFEGLFLLDQIVIYNRQDLPQRAYNMQLFVLGSNEKWELVHDQGGIPFGSGGRPAKVRLVGCRGKALRIQLPSFDHLHLCEVEVYSTAWGTVEVASDRSE